MPEPLVHAMDLACSAEHAFEVFLRRIDLWWPPGHRKFKGSRFACTPEVGGQITEYAPDGTCFVWADITAIDPPHRLVLGWHPGKITAPTRSDITFASAGPGRSRVTVTHSEADAALGGAWPQRAALFSAGWTAVLSALADHISPDPTSRRPDP
ncbi:MAG: SRPBCC domain-containing protein [Pseudomonadota bacterium]